MSNQPRIKQGILWNLPENPEVLDFIARRTSFFRMGLVMHASGRAFRPNDITNDWTFGRSPKDLAELCKTHGLKIVACGLRHNQGGFNGWGDSTEPPYHAGHVEMRRNRVERFWHEFCSYALANEWPLDDIIQDSNEFAYKRGQSNSERYAMMQAFAESTIHMQNVVKQYYPNMKFVSPGNKGWRQTHRGVSLNWFFAESHPEVFDYYDIHYNTMNDEDRERSYAMKDEFPGLKLVSLEGRDYALRDNRAELFAEEAVEYGVERITHFGFLANRRWGVTQSNSHATDNKGLEFSENKLVVDFNCRQLHRAALVLGYPVEGLPDVPSVGNGNGNGGIEQSPRGFNKLMRSIHLRDQGMIEESKDEYAKFLRRLGYEVNWPRN